MRSMLQGWPFKPTQLYTIHRKLYGQTGNCIDRCCLSSLGNKKPQSSPCAYCRLDSNKQSNNHALLACNLSLCRVCVHANSTHEHPTATTTALHGQPQSHQFYPTGPLHRRSATGRHIEQRREYLMSHCNESTGQQVNQPGSAGDDVCIIPDSLAHLMTP